MSGHGLDDELELVALLVDRFPPRTTAQRGAFHLHVERSEEEMLGLVDEQEFGEPPEQERGDVFRFEPELDLSVPHDGQNTLADESPPVSGDVEAARWDLG